MALRDDVFAMLNALYEGAGVEEDSDGDFIVDLGEWVVWVRVHENPQTLTIFTPVASAVPGGPHIDDNLSRINRAYVVFRALWEEEYLLLRADLVAAPLIATQLQEVLDNFGAVAEELREDALSWAHL